MRKHESPAAAEPAPAWHVPVTVEEIPETGQHFDLIADASVRAAVARVAGLRELPRLEAKFDLTRRGGGLHVGGVISATVGQTCVVTLEPLANEIEEEVDLLYLPQQASPDAGAEESEDGQKAKHEMKKTPHDVDWDEPEPLVGGVIDLGALAAEYLILGLDPYPRKPGAVFTPPAQNQRDDGPFAALAKLAKGRDGH